MARKQVTLCDSCNQEIANGGGGLMRANFHDARRGARVADLCDSCMEQLPGTAAARRGRRPRTKELATA